MASAPKKPKMNKKRADLNGWSPLTVDQKLKNLHKGKPTGDWRRDTKLHNLYHAIATINWTNISSKQTKALSGPIPVGMEGLLRKLESAQNRSFKSIPVAIKEEFGMTESSFNPKDYSVFVLFSEPKYGDFRLVYCRICTLKSNLRDNFWKRFGKKLPEENISIQELMKHWDQLNLSWNSQDVLGCLLPNDPKHYALVNARRMIQRPIEHWNTVHEEKKKAQKSQITILGSTPPPPPPSPSSAAADSSSSSSSTTSSAASTKINHRKSDLRQLYIQDVVAPPKINFVGHVPKDENEEMALAHALRILHVGAIKMISSAAMLEQYQTAAQIKEEQFQYYKSLNQNGLHKQTCFLPRPVMVSLKDHNINDGYEAIMKAYVLHNQDENNPYRLLEQVTHWGFIHDATSHWVKELNTVILRAVDAKGHITKGHITKVPFNFRQVPGSLTGEVLAEEIIDNISLVKKVKNNVASTISEALLSRSNSTNDRTSKIDELHSQLKEATNVLDLERVQRISLEIQDLVNSSHGTGLSDDIIIPKPPNYFKMATLKGVDHESKIIHLEIRSENVPTSICGDSCATNLKANRLVTEIYGITSPQADCSSHASSGTIRRTCMSKTMSDPDAVLVYTALRKILKHFSLSAKSTELLNRALDALEQNNVHMLVWRGTRMAGFLDGCKQFSSILVPFIDTLIVGEVREEESAILLTPKGLFTLELFAYLHPVFANQYLHVVNSDKILSCEVFNIAHQTAQKLLSPTMSMPKADSIYNNLSVDKNDNVYVTLVSLDDDDAVPHSLLLNEKLTRHRTFEKVK